MPDGVVQWFDAKTGEGRIARGGRRYAARASSIEPQARVAGARVHFDIAHDSSGSQALRVTLRRGTRTARGQRRFGDLVGARATDTKGLSPFSRARPERDQALEHHPMRVVERWAAALTNMELDTVMRAYAPTATLHGESGPAVGQRAIRRYWERSPLLGVPQPAVVGGDRDLIVARWSDSVVDDRFSQTRLRISHGEIAEQWIGTVWEVGRTEASPIELSTSGSVPAADREYAIAKVAKLEHFVGRPILGARIRLTMAGAPARERPAEARATLDVNGEAVRAHVAAPTMIEAVDLLESRLHRQIDHVSSREDARRRKARPRPPGEWRHGDSPSSRPTYFPRRGDEREIVRHKSFSTIDETVDEAIFDLEAMDYDFFLFRDLATGADAIVYRRDDESHGLRLAHGADEATRPPTATTIEIDPRPAPHLDVAGAREQLDLGDLAWIFFNNATSRRAHVLYRRYDGHYGLITPVDEPPKTPSPEGE